MDRNLFCYGKANSGKTEKVAAQVLRHAIDRDRNCIIFQKDIHPALEALYDAARQKGYQFADIYECNDDWMTLEEIIELSDGFMDKQKVILFIHPDERDWDFAPTQAANFLESLSGNLEDIYKGREGEAILSADDRKIHVILDGLDGGFAIRPLWLQQPQLAFCIICSCNFLSAGWLSGQIDGYLDALEDADALEAHSLYSMANFMADHRRKPRTVREMLGNLLDNIQEFFEHFSTIACTGVDGTSPENHKTAIGVSIFARDKGVNVGGRYIVSELENRFEAVACKTRICTESSSVGRGPSGTRNLIPIDGEIENSIYGLLSYAFRENLWVIQVDGRILEHYVGDMYGPVLLFDRPEAIAWLRDYLITQSCPVYLISETDQEVVYGHKWRDHEGAAHEMRFSAVKVAKENVENMKDNFLINALDIEDAEARLERYEAFYRDKLDRASDWDRKLIRYFPESIEYFKLFTYTHKIEEHERRMEEEELKRQTEKQFEVPEEYRWKPYAEQGEDAENDTNLSDFDPIELLPKEGVLFLGGHQNMTKKLRNIFPGWTFLSDDLFRNWNAKQLNAVFYWYNHSSHSMMEYVNARKDGSVPYLYVTATNIDRLIKEMADRYVQAVERKQAG